MRHLIAHIATLVIAALLLGGAALFAWLRSSQLVIATDAQVLARYEAATAHAFEWRELGAASYVRNCMNCHLADGSGWDQYPALHATGEIFGGPGGRQYLVDLHLNGVASPRWRAPMPPMRHLQDVELAAVLNHVLVELAAPAVPLSDDRLYEASDIAERRGQASSPHDVGRARPRIAR